MTMYYYRHEMCSGGTKRVLVQLEVGLKLMIEMHAGVSIP